MKFLVGFFSLLACTLMLLMDSAGAEPQKSRYIGYLEEAPLWTASQALKSLLEESEPLTLVLTLGAFFSPGTGKQAELDQAAEALMARTDLDMILVSGAQAAAALLRANNGKTPVLAFVIEDGEASHFVTQAGKVGACNFSVRLDTGFARLGVQFFHFCTKFRKLGIFTRPKELDGIYSIANTIIDIGNDLGFTVVPYELPLTETPEECERGIARLLEQGIDAFYVGGQQCFDPEKGQIARLLKPLSQAGVPTFAREGAEVVRQGALMGNSSNDFKRRGNLLAQQMNSIFFGAQPYGMPMESTTIPRYSLNLKVLEYVGIDPPFAMLAACDEFFETIVNPKAESVSDVTAQTLPRTAPNP